MARRHNSIQPLAADKASHTGSRRGKLVFAVVVLSILVLAWYDGGEEPIRPISHELAVPEAD